MHEPYADFSNAFPRENDSWQPIDIDHLKSRVREKLAVDVPVALMDFWRQAGSGYFADRELYVFGDGITPMDRDSLVDWNSNDFWRDIFPAPSQGGPVFFAENCFGEAIGFRWEENACLAVLFIPETFDSFVLADSFENVFTTVLNDRYGCTDPDRLRGILDRLGKLPRGKHFVPIVSPLLGGSGTPDNFSVETANVHMRTALATYQSIHG